MDSIDFWACMKEVDEVRRQTEYESRMAGYLTLFDSLAAGLGGVCAAATCGTIAVFRSKAQRYEQIHMELAPKPRSTCFQ